MMNFVYQEIISKYFNPVTLTLCFIAVVTFVLYTMYHENKRLPPGPTGLPLVGYLPFLKADAYPQFCEFKKKYGNVFSLRMGPDLLTILSDWESLKEVMSNSYSLNRNGSIFIPLINIGFSEKNGEEWSEERKLTRYLMRELGIGKHQWENAVYDEALQVIEKLKALKGQPIDISDMMTETTIKSIFSFLVGRSSDESELNLFKAYLSRALSEVTSTGISTFFPALRKLAEFFPRSTYGNSAKIFQQIQDMLKNEIEKHKTLPEYEGVNDFINLYLERKKELTDQGKFCYFSDHNLIGNLASVFLGASDTTHVSLEFLFRQMAKHQDIQEKVQSELDKMLGDERMMFDKRQLVPYTMAVILENVRFSSIAPISASRIASGDIQIGNYTIPKGSGISANLRLINHDTKYWNEPEKFNPQNFLNEDGTKVLTNRESFAAFSYGRRNCPGESIAYMEILVFFSTIIQRFKVSLVPGEEAKFDTSPGIVTPLVPQRLCFQERTVRYELQQNISNSV